MNWDWEKLQERRQRKPSPQDSNEEGGDFDKIIGKNINRLQKMDFPWGKALIGMLVLLWLLSGIFIVNADEKGVVLRFGKFVRTVDPGPHYHLPFPIETVYKPKVQAVQRMEIGYGADSARARTPGGSIDEASMLTGDENIVFVQFVVQFRIDPEHPERFLFNVADPLGTVRSASQASMREVMGSSQIDAAITDGRRDIELKTMSILQSILDDYKSGIIITGVEMQDVHPPQEAMDAFMDVASAREDKSKIINQAEAYRNEILPRARGLAAQTLNEAEAYKQSVVLKADGDTKRFLAVLEEFNKAKSVTAKRMYLDTLEEIMSNPNIEKIILPEGNSAGPILPFLPLNSITSAPAGATGPAISNPAANEKK